MTMRPEKPCIFECGKTLVYDATLPSPSFREIDTAIHHTFKRCAELIGPDASRRFAEYKKKTHPHDKK